MVCGPRRPRRRPALSVRLASTTALAGLLFGSAGCAVHYGHVKHGVETAWGVGRVTWRVDRLTNGWATVSSGTRLPGLVLGVGPDFFGISLGYHIREHLRLVPVTEPDPPRARINGRELADDAGGRWGVGRLKLETPDATPAVILTGSAGAGLGLGLVRGRPELGLGWQSRQLSTVHDLDIWVELTGPARPWPYFDFPATRLAVVTPTNFVQAQGPP